MLNHIVYTKSARKDLTKELKSAGDSFNQSADWISTINYAAISKKPVIWLDWATINKNYGQLYKELHHEYPHLPIIIFHSEEFIPKSLCTQNQSVFAVIDKKDLLGSVQSLIPRLNIYYDFLLSFKTTRDIHVYPNGFGPFVGNSTIMLLLYQMIYKISSTDYNVLITGESGTGKELTAQMIHRLGNRKNGPFVSINCAAIPDNLLESELFGYEKGAFTDATQAKPGKFELADKGTIFLDEIGDMPLNLQTKLLRVLEDHKIERLGGTKEKTIDIRLIAATNQNIDSLIRQGEFRPELQFRLNVLSVNLKPLKNRDDDLVILVLHILRKLINQNPEMVKSIQWDLIKSLSSMTFSGNVRELENVLIRSIFQSNFPELVPEQIQPLQNEPVVIEGVHEICPLWEVEKQAIFRTLNAYDWNISKTAEILEISRASLYRKIKQYQLDISR